MGKAADRPLHLLSVWNPSYVDDAMDQHLGVFLNWAERRDRGKADEEEVYVWWGKVRSEHREDELPHADDILALNDQIKRGTETHLYLTDHRSLYVGQLVEVTDEPILEAWEGEREHAPGYYQEHAVDFWFMLWDLRRLVHRDTPAVVSELRHLRNTRYHDHPVSLYGGLVELPLLVRRDDDTRWFDDRESLLEGKRWAERDATLRGETERMAAELRDNLLGPEVWHAGARDADLSRLSRGRVPGSA